MFKPGFAYSLIIYFTTVFCVQLHAQQLDWISHCSGPGFDSGRSVNIDVEGNIVHTGFFQDSLDFDPGPGNDWHYSNGQLDIFLQKLDALGNVIWTKTFGGAATEEGFSVCIDGFNNICLTGYYTGTVDFDPGISVYNMNAVGGTDIFIVKLDADGNFIWARSMGGPGSEEGSQVICDAMNNIYACGQFQQTADFDPGPGIFNLVSGLDDNGYIVKLNSQGNFIWASQTNGPDEENVFGIYASPNGDVIATGRFTTYADFEPGPGNTTLFSNQGSIFLWKLDSNANLLWVKQIGGSQGEAYALKCFNNQYIYITGVVSDTTDMNPYAGTYPLIANGIRDGFIAKYDTAGHIIWANNIGNSGITTGQSIAVDPYDNVYCSGIFSDTLDADPGLGVWNLYAQFAPMYYQKFDPIGNLISAFNTEQTYLLYGGQNLVVDNIGFAYLAGNILGPIDADPGPGNQPETCSGGADISLSKIGFPNSNVATPSYLFSTNVYPNPGLDVINIDLNSNDNITLQIEILDLHGQLISNQPYYNDKETLILSTKDLPAGCYLLRIVSQGNICVKKWIKL